MNESHRKPEKDLLPSMYKIINPLIETLFSAFFKNCKQKYKTFEEINSIIDTSSTAGSKTKKKIVQP